MIEAMKWIVNGFAVIVIGGISALWITLLLSRSGAVSDHGPGDPPKLPEER